MAKRKLSLQFASRSHRFIIGAALLCALSGLAQEAYAATARVTWLPRGTGTATGYNVYVRNAAAPYGASPQWSGNPTPAANGSMSATVTYTPATSGTNYFAVVAVSSTNGETGLSGELPIGTASPCRTDSCTTKTSCTFGNRPDGSPCDDASFCNGPEVCLAGVCDTSPTRNCADAVACTVDACDDVAAKCTHTGPPGCCATCDSTDPCLAAACAQGDCSGEAGTDIVRNLLRFQNKPTGIKLAARGSFVADPTVDPSTTGIILEMRAPDGTVLYTSALPAHAVKVGASPGRYRVVIPRPDSGFLSNGLTVLDFRIKGSTWAISAKMDTPELMDAFLEPTLTWAIRLGTTCVRAIDLPCAQKATRSICREPRE